MKPYCILVFVFSFFSPYQDDCNKLPKTFFSYNEALCKIKESDFNFKDKLTTSNSSWITSANFYSCDGKKGYLIIGTKEQIYIHQNLPVNLWHGFKSALSYGSYYTHNIRNRYQLHLSK